MSNQPSTVTLASQVSDLAQALEYAAQKAAAIQAIPGTEHRVPQHRCWTSLPAHVPELLRDLRLAGFQV